LRNNAMSDVKHKRIAIAFTVSLPWMARCFQGIADYAQEHGPWSMFSSPPAGGVAEELVLDAYSLKDWRGDGVIAVITDPAEARAARRLHIPVVNLAAAMQNCGLPRVTVDHYAVGRLAAEHLLSRGLRNLAYTGLQGLWYSQERQRGFVDRASEDGVQCEVFESSPMRETKASWGRRTAPLLRWLRTLPPPAGILAVQDYRARIVVDECLELGLRVPHDVAVIGVDNDSTVCELCQPTLSSVSRQARQVGYEAAALLDRLMAGQKPPSADILIPPEGIVARQSTDTFVVSNPHVCEAIQLMHDHLGTPISVEHILRHAAISRRLLEKLFRRHLGCTPRDYLCRLRIERAKQLLGSSKKMKVQDVARAVGFGDLRAFRNAFCKIEGTTALQYRNAQAVGR
jgi:LacI family transcriptional regulator